MLSQYLSILHCQRPIQSIVTAEKCTKGLKNLTLTLTKCFLCLNLTIENFTLKNIKLQRKEKVKFQQIHLFTKAYIYSDKKLPHLLSGHWYKSVLSIDISKIKAKL